MSRIEGSGNPNARIAIIGSGPNWQDARSGKPFSGKVGAELDHFLKVNDLPPRGQLWLTNVYREFVDKDHEYSQEDLERDLPDLHAELDWVKPEIIVPLGREATQVFLGEVDVHAVWGIPWRLDRSSGSGRPTICFPQFHIAAGFHNSDLACYVTAGFQALAAYVRGETQARRLGDDQYPNPTYEEITSEARLEEIAHHWSASTFLGVDTEGWRHAPYSLQFSDKPGTGYFIRATSPVLSRFCRLASERKTCLVFHSALHDLEVMEAMGIPWTGPFEDTMANAYLLQLEAQGLKPGCLRHCGMVMRSYDDLMGDVANERAKDWLMWLRHPLLMEHRKREQGVFDMMLGAGRRVKKMPKLPKSRLLKSVERCLASKEPRRLWGDQQDEIQAEGIRRLGFMPEPSLDDVEPADAVQYACRDADATLRYSAALRPKLTALGLDDVYKLELSTYPLLARMMRVGVKPDLKQFARLSGALGMELVRLQDELETATQWEGFNANSGDHVAEFLFGTCGLEPMKMTRSGDRGSTNDKVLEALERAHPEYPVVGLVRQYRETHKLKYTFVDPLPAFVDRWPYDGRVHCTIKPTRVITGRLAAADPNMLAQPEHGAFAKEFKRGWICEPGHVLYAADQSQVELRGLAHLSQDPVMCAVYRGERRNPDGTLIDLHASLAERIFGVKPALQDKSKHRLPAKEVNFMIPNGATKHGLKIELRKNGVEVDEDDAQRWLDEAMALYTGVPIYMEYMKQQARDQGYIRCLSGRIRYIGGINSPDERVREEAERFSFSTPIQESAQYAMKLAEGLIWRELLPDYWGKGIYVEPLIQIHDSLKWELAEGLHNEFHERISAMMTTRINPFCVPLAVEGEWGYTMADMQGFTEEA